MAWVYQDKNNHKCKFPSGDSSTAIGDIWQCDCGAFWRVTKCEYKGDQRDSWYDVQWTRHTGAIPKQRTGADERDAGTVRPHKLSDPSEGPLGINDTRF